MTATAGAVSVDQDLEVRLLALEVLAADQAAALEECLEVLRRLAPILDVLEEVAPKAAAVAASMAQGGPGGFLGMMGALRAANGS